MVGPDGLAFDRQRAVAHLSGVDARVAALVDAVGPYAVQPDQAVDAFAYLLRSIVYQQLHGAAAAAIHGRLLELYGGAVPTPQQLAATSVEQLRGAGLSASKASSAHDLARYAAAGQLPTTAELPQLPDLEIVDRLTVVRGIGPWTVHMLLLFQLGRADVLPTGDFGVREGWRLLHDLPEQPTPARLRELTAHWRPYRSVASWYMWRCVDLHRTGRPIARV
jgi:3-methyladenine DNA glycosylase/8-oxoguanine DNA glycosylase